MIDLTKKFGETERQYLWRIGTAIENGSAGLTWEEATPYINKEWREDESEYRTSSAYRKQVQYAIPFYEEIFSKYADGDYEDLFLEQKDELYKLKRQLYDQRREYNKILTADARWDHLEQELIKCAESLNDSSPLIIKDEFAGIVSDREAVICFSDFHYGMVTDNIWNRYNTDICRERLSEVVSKMTSILAENKPRKIHILLLGDAAHGGIHTSARVASEENVCDQIMQVSELIAQAIDKISIYAPETMVYSTYGNHLRTIQNKKDSIHEDNMEKLIPWWLRQRFKDRSDIVVVYSNCNEFIPVNVCGYNIVGVHGDLDGVKNAGVVINTLFSKLYGETIDYAILADKHHIESFESFGIESMIVGSLCGTDEYANNRRLYSNPNQALMIFTERDGKYCQYNVQATVNR